MKKIDFISKIQVVLAVIMLLCLCDMPYGYYEFTRFFSMVCFLYFAYKAYQEKNEKNCFIYGGLVLLFQPFFKIQIGRTMWNIVDVIVAIWLLYLAYTKIKNTLKNHE